MFTLVNVQIIKYDDFFKLVKKNMNENVFMQGITVDSLLRKIEEIIDTRFDERVAQLLKPPTKIQYLSRKEVSEFLKVSLVTIHKWTKQGLIHSYRIGRKVVYKKDEIEEALIKRKFR
jgi:excisionase family DNA binding protein